MTWLIYFSLLVSITVYFVNKCLCFYDFKGWSEYFMFHLYRATSFILRALITLLTSTYTITHTIRLHKSYCDVILYIVDTFSNIFPIDIPFTLKKVGVITHIHYLFSTSLLGFQCWPHTGRNWLLFPLQLQNITVIIQTTLNESSSNKKPCKIRTFFKLSTQRTSSEQWKWAILTTVITFTSPPPFPS